MCTLSVHENMKIGDEYLNFLVLHISDSVC